MKSQLTHLTTGSRVRSHIDPTALGFTYGTVVGIAAIGPWVKVQWDDGKTTDRMAGELIAADAPWPKHYHRCQWCGLLTECEQACAQDEKPNADGTFDGGHCDSICYHHRRPRGCQSHHDEDGRIVDLTVPF